MDLSTYKDKLTQEERLQVWQEFQETPGWQLLKQMFLQEQSKITDITDCDSEKAFIYQQTKLKGKAEFFNKPQELIGHITRGMNRA